ncbi:MULTISPECIES: AEC family transporter [unclassified Lysobacter]|uniref:AEC family transporter n=1 Tax=unclassified Lysobacter TaxID=2635362 RepID=UPI001BE8283A|nr:MULTISPECIES: AEC family transporter [unclassified Lysobacter]MBT2747210.1 AEC family transporter [Lysobacter sp. ISL-42]MBT2750286.1 AEC family transporter [Lysobacter sp. ISL-50]MBT2777748.1 AEC family transporter [Lysobacter sp. ISL-54]MBT2783684.1 AEC family transporter [Lysobacter sp. ISL-52]
MAFDAFALVLAMLALGYLFLRLRALPDNAAQTLNLVVLYVCLPAAVLRYAPRLHLEPALLGVAAVPWLLLGATVLLVGALARVLGLRRDEHAVLLLTVALGNTSFLGYPLTRALIGEHALPYAVVYDQFGAFLILSTFGLWVLARYGGDAPPSARAMVLRVLKFPPLWALLIGFSVMPEQPPSWIAGGLQRLSDALLPLAMLTIGLSVKLALPREELKPLIAGLGLKLALMPALAWVLVPMLGLHGEMARATVLEAAMPPMVTAGALAIAHQLAPRLAAAMVGYGLLLSLLTLPLWAQVAVG